MPKKFQITLLIMPKKSVLDPAGLAIKNTLQDIGFGETEEVRLGKALYLTVAGADATAAKKSAMAQAQNLLAHEMMEEAMIIACEELV